MNHLLSSSALRPKPLLLPLGLLASIVVGWLTAGHGPVVVGLLIALAVAGPFGLALFRQPRLGIIGLVVYCFLLFILVREVGGIPYGMAVDALLVLTWVAVAFNHERFDWRRLRNDLGLVTLLWLGYNLLELGNPAGASLAGWFQEMRSTALYWSLGVPLAMLLFTRRQDLNLFLVLILGLSVLGALNGLKQQLLGLSPGEQAFLDENTKTHLLWGKLRVFSFYSDAGQFGAAQAHILVVALVLALGPFAKWQRLLLLAAAGLLLVGMLLSGTRGALFALGVGIAVALLISKNIKALVLGGLLALGCFGVLKYTTIGNQNYSIYRLRTALDPQDASLNVRLRNQLALRDYLSSRPFGGGVGSIGNTGIHYNAGQYLATIPPDSYWVKVWAMYGIVGFVLWLGIMLYILGKCCGIVWRIRDKQLKVKLLALTAGFAGSLVCSYGNEVINFMPSALIVYLTWAFVFAGPRLDRPAQQATS
ncbi:O-antigen ligase family protein [Hymenobacter metallicola]|uniref:O-antigen ligase domain-containing protein n=1 Tax=Hymenobacter metallicola TaxID=2563114 RepID=A0A4Z0QIZ8_9BACT|nr:O-antigen ligase family protein [Hymenobacter metallicola]TGE28662.1 O-antigen ligase domain-containing protein [Hymenobacter metallicola]